MKLHNIVALIMIILGIIFISATCALVFFDKNGYEETTAVIQQIERKSSGTDSKGKVKHNYYVYVTYTANDVVYDHQYLGTYFADYYVGKQLKIYYNKRVPTDIKVDNTFIGIIIVLVGAALIVASFFVRRIIKKAEENPNKKKPKHHSLNFNR